MCAELEHIYGGTDGWTDRQTDRQTDITKLIVTFHKFANAPKNQLLSLHQGTSL
jgi:hypothetical protein